MSDLTWINDIDVTKLSPKAQAQYAEYKAAYAMAKAAREAFESEVISGYDMPKGKTLAFGYRFGKLSIALADAKPTKGQAQGRVDLSQFLANMAQSGQRA